MQNLVFDPSPIVAELPADFIAAARKRATWISANVREASILSGIADPAQAARALAEERPENGGVVVRDGKQGCYVATRDHCEKVDAFEVDAVDTNGAGDTHLGSFIARLARGDTPRAAARYANIAAALSTTRRGPATAPSFHEVFTVLNQKEAIRR